MMTKIPSGGAGSCGGLVEYLEKEVAGLWFDRQQELLAGHQVVVEIDQNKKNLGRQDDKYYQLILAPSQAELAHIGSDPEKLQAFTRAAMEQYAQNFGKGIESKDLVWFAKVEHSRSYDHTDRIVQLGEQERGVPKAGDQTHIHVLVSRTENLKQYREGKENGQHERKNPYHLSPKTNHKATTKGPVVGGFERNAFSQRVEQTFDQEFGYERPLTQSFQFLHCMKYGDELAKEKMQRQALQEAQKRVQQPQDALVADAFPSVKLTPERDVAADLRDQLSEAFEQKDVNELSKALATAQAERERQQQIEEARKQALAAKLAEQQKVEQQQKLAPKEEEQQNKPRISRGLRR
ncbi:DUF5712 family protein [Spirosoma soli]|uniref:DUF5712 family protein n=1 Tax=Spirosoma soli TaxID=1770529 RepID=A0ABW5ME93_9BACT